jgi:hypothetical protein
MVQNRRHSLPTETVLKMTLFRLMVWGRNFNNIQSHSNGEDGLDDKKGAAAVARNSSNAWLSSVLDYAVASPVVWLQW